MPDDDTDPLEGGDTEEMAFVLEDADVEEFTEEDTTAGIRCCSECGRPVLAMGVVEAPRIEDLILPVYWTTCSVSGPAEFPTWWFCPHERWFAIVGSYRVRITKLN